MNWLGELVQRHVEKHDIVLDLGCGIMQATTGLTAEIIIGCDVWKPYLEEIKNDFPVIKIEMSELDRFMDSSYDVVICLDVIEHLEESLSLKVIDEMKRICRKKAIIYTPSSFVSNEESIKNAWGLGENEHQRHKCLITAEILSARGYHVRTNNEDGGNFAVFQK